MTTSTQTIQKGYKQTDIGVIPADWSVLDYVSFGKVIDGDRGIQYPGTRDFTDVGFCLFLNAGNVTKSGFRFTDCQFISAEKDKKLGNGKLTRGDVVLTTRGTVGNLAFFDDKAPFDQIRINSGMVILRNTSSAVANTYQYQMLRSQIITSQIEHLSFGSAQPQLTVKGISTLKVPLPPTKDEQEAIASILLDTDALIEKLEKLIDKKKNVKSGTMQELLTGKRRLSGFNGKWELISLGEVAEFDHGRGLPKSDLSEDGPYKCIHYGQLFTGYKELIHKVKSKTYSNEGRFYSKANDVLMPTSDVTPRGLATASCIKEDGVILGGGILVIRLHSNYDGLYFSYFVSQNKNSVLRFVKGSTVFHLYANDLANFEVSFPEVKEQVAIATVLSDMDTEIEKLESQLTKYQNLKQGMMQVLLTGKIRLLSK